MDIKIILLFLLATFSAFSQDKNTLLDRKFWTKDTSIEQVQEQIQKGNSPSQLDAGAFDPVSIAIMQLAPNPTILYLLQQEGNYIDKHTHDSRTYLHWAGLVGNTFLVDYLIKQGYNVHAKDSRGMTPLTFACERAMTSPEVAEMFFSAGVDPLQKYKNGETIMHISIHNDTDLKLLDYLISKGLSLNDVDNQGSTLFDYSAKKGNIPQMKKLLQRGVKHTDNSLLFAATGARRFVNSIAVYQYLIDDLGVNVNVTNQEGQNALHLIASRDDHQPIIQYLINKKIQTNLPDKQGNTPFMMAAKGKNIETLQLLLPKSKEINSANKQGQTALSNAVEYGTAPMVQFLIQKKANTQVTDVMGNNLAYYWIQSYRPAKNIDADFLAKRTLLQQKKVDFKAQQQNGTLYHLAVMKNDLELLKSLSSFDIDLNAQNTEGETVLMKAAMIAKDDAILRYLISLGADKSLTTEFGETAYDLAKENEILQSKKIAIDFLK